LEPVHLFISPIAAGAFAGAHKVPLEKLSAEIRPIAEEIVAELQKEAAAPRS
jgi:hypothetical protein